MIRTQIQLEDHIHRQVRRLALEKEVSMAELIRRFVHEGLSRGAAPSGPTELAFIGAGASGTGDLAENHDKYLNEEV
jgi:hypothetical protein